MLKIENLVVKYGLAEALHGIALEVPAGQIVAVLGANGAGKTTLLRAVSGLQRASQGSSILFEGAQLRTKKPEDIVKLGIAHVPEGRQVFSTLSVKDNLRLGAYSIRDKKQIGDNMDKMFELFPRLAERANQTAGTLSGGEQQMLAIARAMMSSPKFLMLDEPSMGLAPVIVEKIYENIMDLNNRLGLTPAGGTECQHRPGGQRLRLFPDQRQHRKTGHPRAASGRRRVHQGVPGRLTGRPCRV